MKKVLQKIFSPDKMRKREKTKEEKERDKTGGVYSRAKIEGMSDKEVESVLARHRQGAIKLTSGEIQWLKHRKEIGW